MPIPNISTDADSAIGAMVKNLLASKDGKEKKS